MNRFRATAVTVLWALAVTASVHAADGRITFRGAVVVTTCGPGPIDGPSARPADKPAYARCPQAGPSAAYTLRVEPAASHSSSQLLTYYVGYVLADGIARQAWVATQVYD